jgi:hypothetical protein
MNPFSKLASFLVTAGLLAVVLAVFTPVGHHVGRVVRSLPGVKAVTEAATQDLAGARKSGEAIQVMGSEPGATAVANANVTIPAIRGENNYGWVQLPRGTPVDLLRRTADSLIVRWDGSVVQVPPMAALSGAIALRTPAHADPRY